MPASLAASVCGVVVERDGETVAMGRVVGDGAFYERHGFAVHAGMTGMFRVVPARAPGVSA